MSSYIDIIRVSGAGTAAVNGDYLRDGDAGGKPLYRQIQDPDWEIGWERVDSGFWEIISSADDATPYRSEDDTPLPDLATFVINTGDAPAPTVTRVYSTALTKDDGDWSIAKPDGNYTVEEPFFEVGDAAHKVILWPHVQAAEFRAPLALDTPHPFIPDAYLVNEFGFQDIGGGIDRWFREYATIPASRRELSGTEVFQFPGLPPTLVDPVRREIDAVTFSGTEITITTDAVHGLVAGNFCVVTIKYRRGSSLLSGTLTQTFTAICLAGTTGSTVKVRHVTIGFTPVFLDGYILEGLFPGRPAFSIPAQTVTDYEYFLPGVTPGIESFEDVQPDGIYQPLNISTGRRTTALVSALAARYRTSVIDGEYLTLSSKVERYKGNIFVRESKRVKAQ